MQDELDRLIDEGLAAYGAVEPLAGLEERVLGRARAQRRSRRWWWLAAPVAAAAGLSVWMVGTPRPKIAPPVVALAKPPAPVVVAPSSEGKRVVIRRAAKRAEPPVRTELPKRAVFPTVARLTTEERLLLRLAESRPMEVARPVVPAGDIEIKPIEIAPLSVDGAQ